MNTSELRIGNYICDPNEEIKYYKVEEILKGFDQYLICYGFGMFRTGVGLIEPIPLTEEILLKCGIEVIDDNPKKKPHYNGDVIFKISGLEFSNSMRDSFYCFEFGIEINSLHQLQNLYYAITGEELEVKL